MHPFFSKLLLTAFSLMLLNGCAQERTTRYLNRNVPLPPFQPTSILVNPQPIGTLSFPEPTPHAHLESEVILSERAGQDSRELKALYDALSLKELKLPNSVNQQDGIPGIRLQKSLGRLSCFKSFTESTSTETTDQDSAFDCHVSVLEDPETQKLDQLIYVSLDAEEIAIPGLKETRRFLKTVGVFYCLKSIEMTSGQVEFRCGVNPSP